MNFLIAMLVVILMVNVLIIIIMYAYDICIMPPSGTTMQNLLVVYHNYGI